MIQVEKLWDTRHKNYYELLKLNHVICNWGNVTQEDPDK